MRLVSFRREKALAILDYDGHAVAIAPIAQDVSNAHVALMYIDPNGLIGYHQAVGNQLFLVVQGSGWVAGPDRQLVPIQTGQAAFWTTGELHAAGSESGMMAVVVEAESITLRDNPTP